MLVKTILTFINNKQENMVQMLISTKRFRLDKSGF